MHPHHFGFFIAFWLLSIVSLVLGLNWHMNQNKPAPPRPAPPLLILILEDTTAPKSQDQQIQDLEARLWWLQKSQCGKVVERDD